MDENQLIEQKFGKKTPFKVPEGYFDALAKNVMEQLPENKARIVPLRSRVRWRMVAGVASAACFIALLLNADRLWTASPDNDALSNQATVSSLQTAYYDDDLEEIADYAMMDVDDIYAYVSDYQ